MQNRFGETPLILAAIHGDEKLAKQSIEAGVPLEIKDGAGYNAVSWAMMNGHVSILQLLIDSKADFQFKDKQSNSLLHLAAAMNVPSVIPLLIEKGINVNTTSQEKDTPLHIASRYGHPDCVSTLIHLKADIHLENKRKQTAIKLSFENPECFKIYFGMMSDQFSYQEFVYALTIAVSLRLLHCVKDLIAIKSDLEENDISEIFYSAIATGDVSLVKYIYETFKMKNDRTIQYGFENAARQGHVDVLSFLLDKVKTEHIWDGLIVAVRHAQVHATNSLINRLSQTDLSLDDRQKLENYRKEAYDKRKSQNNTALIGASHRGNQQLIAKLLHENIVDVNVTDDSKATPLIHAALNLDHETVKLLLKKKPELNHQDDYGTTALIAASNRGSKEIIQMLLEAEADTTFKNKQGTTAIDRAVHHGNLDAITLLAKANPELFLDILPTTPAVQKQQKVMVEEIKKNIDDSANEKIPLPVVDMICSYYHRLFDKPVAKKNLRKIKRHLCYLLAH